MKDNKPYKVGDLVKTNGDWLFGHSDKICVIIKINSSPIYEIRVYCFHTKRFLSGYVDDFIPVSPPKPH
tara:strand:+ start:648 stop:854 length:207 start_codon:yes stop_codon:yes gene_type:complete